jgi:hypothetical protein
VRGALLLDLPLSGVRWLGGDQQRGFRARGEPSGTRTGRITTSGSLVSIEDEIKARAHILGKESSPAAPKMDCRLVALHPRAQGGAALRGVDGGLRRTPRGGFLVTAMESLLGPTSITQCHVGRRNFSTLPTPRLGAVSVRYKIAVVTWRVSRSRLSSSLFRLGTSTGGNSLIPGE